MTRAAAPARASAAPAVLLLLLAATAPRAGGQGPPTYAQLRAPGGPLPPTDGRIIVGGLGINGQATFNSEFSPLFATYLNSQLSASLNKTFSAVYLDFSTSYSAVTLGQLDFIYVNPSIYACLESQYGVAAVASIQTLRPAPLPPYTKVPQSLFGANFFVLANRTDLPSDLVGAIRGRRLEGADLTGLGAGQAQWRELHDRNVSFWNLPSAVIFSRNQGKVAADIAAGKADVGMVRTDLLEGLQASTCAAPSTCFPFGTFRILEPRTFAGFPFNTSTVLYPEWPVAAMPHVDIATRKAVAAALWALDSNRDPQNYTKVAKIATFTTPLSYIGFRDMQHSLGWIDANNSCITSTQTYDTIICEPGTFKKSAAVVAASCSVAGVPCPAGYDCACSPCAPVPSVPLLVSVGPSVTPANASACAKLEVCALVTQNTPLQVTLTDAWYGGARAALGVLPPSTVMFKFHGSPAGLDAPWVPAVASGNGTWTLALDTPVQGYALLEAAVDGVSLESSPFVLSILQPVCPGRGASPTAAGVCVCPPGYVQSSAGDCSAPGAAGVNVGAAVGGAVGGFALLVLVVVGMLIFMHHRAEAVWRIPLASITFSEPPEVLGRGTFGLVVKGAYRGTTVALKRTLPAVPASQAKRSNVDNDLPPTALRSQRTSQFDMNVAPGLTSTDKWAGSQHAGSALQSVNVESAPPRASQQMRLSAVGSKLLQLDAGLTSFAGNQSQSGRAHAASGLIGLLARRRRAAALRADFVREMRLVVHLRHPHITTVLGAVLQRDSDPILVMELMDRGSLYDLLHNSTLVLDGDVMMKIMGDVVSGMAFLHAASPPVLHNDLKSANVLVDSSFRAKVADFGLSGKSHSTGCAPGTPFWMAPELLRGEQPTTATDVYAFGVTLSEVFMRRDPYDREDASAVLASVARGAAIGSTPKRPALLASVPPLFADLMRRCWHDVPAVRPSMAAIAAELRAAGHDSAAVSVTTALLASVSSHQAERQLLHSVFPPAIAEALAAGRRVEPQHFDSVTIFFSDIVGFTDICARLPPLKVMHLLERLYTVFDSLTAKHGLFKVETIGDAYMTCGNLMPGQEGTHAARVAAFAADAVAAAASVRVDVDDPAAGSVAIRAGFHTGPVVASVVGSTNPRYCLFGDSVNTASRCESNSVEGRITLSEAAVETLRLQAPGAAVTSRGLVAVKGKGSLPLFFLASPPALEEQSWLASMEPEL